MDEQDVPETTGPSEPAAAPPPEQASATAQFTPEQYGSLQRAYTQVTQKQAAIAAALGIPKSSSAEQFISAIQARAAQAAASDDAIQSDPRLAAMYADIRAREERVVRQQYGASADLALTLRDAAATMSLTDLAQLVDEQIADRVASRAGAPTAPAATAAAAPQAAAPQAPPVPERSLMGDVPRGTERMYDPGVQPEAGDTPESWAARLIGRVPLLQR